MGYEGETRDEESISTIEPWLLPQNVWSPQDRSGSQTPPFFTEAAVPFQWEEEPGKPRPCIALVPLQPEPHELGKRLPPTPRMLTEAILAKMPPPSTDFPEFEEISRTRYQSSSFRITREHHGLIDGGSINTKGSISQRYDGGGTRAHVPSGRIKQKEKGWFLSWLRKVNLARGKSDAAMGNSNSSSSSSSSSSCIFPSSTDRESDNIWSWNSQGTENNTMTTITRTTTTTMEGATGSPPMKTATVRREESSLALSPDSTSHSWANIYQSWKKRSTKPTKMGS